MTPHPSTLTLHRLRYGELDGPTEHGVRDHLGTCTRCAARLTVQDQERAAFVVRPMSPEIRALATPKDTRRSWWADLFPFALGAVAASVLFVSVPDLRTSGAEPPVDEIRFRGHLPSVEAWVDQGTGPRVLRDADVLGAGDRIQLTYDPQGASYVAIAGRDGTGTIEVYSTRAPTGAGLVQAPFALTLDDVPGLQELFVVGSNRPLEPADVKAAVVSGVSGTQVARVVIRKREAVR